MALHTGPGQGWGKQGSQVVRGPATPIKPPLSAFQGVLGESGDVLSPFLLPWLVAAPSFPDQGLSQGCHHRQASAHTSPRDLRTQRNVKGGSLQSCQPPVQDCSFFPPPCFQLSLILTKVSQSLVFCLFPSWCPEVVRRINQWVPGKGE